MGRQNTYANPFILERADPFMIKADDGWYYFTASYPMKRGDDPEGYDRVILRRSYTSFYLGTGIALHRWNVVHFLCGKQ